MFLFLASESRTANPSTDARTFSNINGSAGAVPKRGHVPTCIENPNVMNHEVSRRDGNGVPRRRVDQLVARLRACRLKNLRVRKWPPRQSGQVEMTSIPTDTSAPTSSPVSKVPKRVDPRQRGERYAILSSRQTYHLFLFL